MRLTTYNRNLVRSDGEYLSTDMIFGADKPQMSSTVDRDLYKLSLADSNMVLAAEFDEGLNGASVVVSVGFLDFATNLPEVEDILITYKGIVESYSYAIDTSESGSVRATVSCSNLMASLDDADPFYTSKQALKQIHATDTSFDQIYEGSGTVNLRWGKK
jgi:hypothetical protein